MVSSSSCPFVSLWTRWQQHIMSLSSFFFSLRRGWEWHRVLSSSSSNVIFQECEKKDNKQCAIVHRFLFSITKKITSMLSLSSFFCCEEDDNDTVWCRHLLLNAGLQENEKKNDEQCVIVHCLCFFLCCKRGWRRHYVSSSSFFGGVL
jgi:hypothetical protein